MRDRPSFAAAKEKGRTARGRWMLVNSLPAADRAFSRLGIITTRRVGCAVIRSRLRRAVREFFRVKWTEFRHCADIVVVPRDKAAHVPTLELWNELDYLCKKVGLKS
jgi:ribonuclease P protein component